MSGEGINYGIKITTIRYGFDLENYIQEILEGRGHSSENLIRYYPLRFDMENYYTNQVLRKVLGDPCYSWTSPFSNSRNSFGQSQYYRGHEFSFEKICTDKNRVNLIPKGVFPYKKLALTNFWIVFDNPRQLKLRDLVQTIEFEIGGVRQQHYCCYDIENQINILAYIFGVDGIKYDCDRIYVPLVVPFNVLIFNNTYHHAIIRCRHEYRWITDFDIYANVCDVDAFPELAHTDEYTHECNFVYYRTQFTGAETICIERSRIRLNFIHHCYAIYIMNVSKQHITSIKLLWDNYRDQGVYDEYLLDDIEWFSNHVILWFNRRFKVFEELNKNVNFSCTRRPHFIIENTYTEPHMIEIVALSFDVLSYGGGMSGLRYMG